MISAKFKARGFTFIELIMVIVLLGATALIAMPRLQNIPETRADYSVRKLRSDVRFAQLLAVESQARTRVVFNVAADTYRVERETAPNTWSNIASISGSLGGADLTQAVFNSGAAVIFDSYGIPYDSTGAALTEPAFAELNAKYQLRFRSETGKVDVVTL